MPRPHTVDSAMQRLLGSVEETPAGCLRWTGPLDPDGYFTFTMGGRTVRAHRFMYEVSTGESIPPGLVIDHVCHTRDSQCPGGLVCLHRACLNYRHMEIVTRQENNHRARSRRLTCAHGHRWADGNEYRSPNGRRCCRACNRDAARRLAERKRAQA